MKLKLQNVGGIVEPISIELKEGLNVIKAPNATGKTSFTHGIKLISMENQQLRNHPEFVNDFSTKAIVEVDGEKRIIERKGLSPLSKTAPFFRINAKENIIFAMPENEFLNSVIKGEPIDKFLESFSDAQYYKQLVERDGVLREVKEELDEKYGRLNTEAKEAQSLRTNIEKEKKNLESLQDQKVNLQNKLKEIKHKIKMNKEEEGRLSQLKEDIETLEREIERTKGSIRALSIETKENETLRGECQVAMNRFLKEFPNIDSEIKKMDDKREELEQELEDEEEGIYILIERIDNEISSAENNIEGNKCLSCGRDFNPQQKKQRLQELNKTKDQLNKRMREIETNLKGLNEDIENIKERRREEFFDNQQQITNLDSRIRSNTDDIHDAEQVITRKEIDLKKKREAMKLIKEQIDPKIKKLLDDEELLTRKVNGILGNIRTYEQEYELVEDSEKQVMIIKERYEFLKRVEVLIKEELANLKNIVRNDFNKKIMPIYNKLGFKDFKSIEIDATFRIKVNRKGRYQELNRLSTSERVTLGVIVMLAGKEEYLPDYPFFVLDEITTAYDPVRFKKIIEYLANETKTKYTIVTAFSPTGDKIKVEHKL